MYVIYRNGKRTVRKTFDSYEAARQHIRKILRRQTSLRVNRQPDWPMSFFHYKITQIG